MKLGKTTVGFGHPPFIVAEISGNHNGSLDRALEIVEKVAESGAQAIKLQTYTPDTMTLNLSRDEFVIDDVSSPWHGESLYGLYQRAQTPWDWHEPIFTRARELGLFAFSTPFDESAVSLLESLDAPAYKIASFENIDLPLIRRVAVTGKPLIISTGMASLSEIEEAVRTARDAGCKELLLLKCTSSYPAPPGDSNLATIPYLRETFHCEVGLSDHTIGIGVALASIAFGASMIEKHVHLSRSDGSVDASFSLLPDELGQLVREAERAWKALGTVHFGPTKSEEIEVLFRRSLYIVQDIRKGGLLTAENVRAIRPGYGLPPKHLQDLLGRRVTRDVERGTPTTWDLLRPKDQA